MKKGSPKVNWSDELSGSVRVLGRVLLKVLGWMLSILMTVCLVGVIVGVIVGGAFMLYVKNYLDTSVDDFAVLAEDKAMTTSIYYIDDNGDLVELESERLSALENRVWVKYADMGDYLPNAFVAIEDKRFYEHDGVDWIRTIKVTLDYFLGGGSQGGSTITQQLLKNITGDDDVTIQRKAQEIFRALNLEKKYDKTEILEMYLNNIYLSQSCYGVGAAAYTYFSKDVSELTLIEAAAIAAITQNPSRWDPIIHPEQNRYRRDEVIQQMYDQGYITREEYVEAYGQELVLNPPDEDDEAGVTIHSWYTDAAQQEAVQLLMEEYGYSQVFAEKTLLTGGFSIVTALDPDIQAILEKYYEDDSYWERHDDSPIQPNSSAVIIDPTNGNVVALVGSRGDKNINLGLNYATQTKRPAGSSIKPLSVYGPALEYGIITYGSVFDDTPYNFGTETVNDDGSISYSYAHGYPQNTPDTYQGLTTIHEAVRVSKNTIALKVVQALGLENSYNYLTQKLGISTLVNGDVYSDINLAPLSMGEFSYGVTVKEMTAAYQIFANGGVYNEERIVLQILDSKGNVVVDHEKKSEIVMSEQNASIMTQMLKEVVSSGTASAITLDQQIDCAGKTGTTQNKRDLWFVGYTPYYVCGIWFGYSMPRSLDDFSAVPVKMWDKIMTEVSAEVITQAKNGETTLKTLDPVPGVVTATYCKDSGKLMTDACRADPRGSRAEIGYFAVGTEPTEYCSTHVLVDYDKAHSGIAHPGCGDENIIQVGLLDVYREMPFNITIKDAQYTMQYLTDDYSYDGLTSSMPYYQNLLLKGYYTGKSGSSYYNRICQYHLTNPVLPAVPETTEPLVTDPPAIVTEPALPPEDPEDGSDP